ncbi:MAG: hypothetical protein RR890_02360 [Longicatena sp.]
MKRKIKRSLELFLLILALGISYFSCTFVLNRAPRGTDRIRVKNFYLEEKNSLDIVMIGSSYLFTAYSAPLAWHKSGLTSYALATNSAPMGIAKSMIIEARKRQDPKLFLIDFTGILYNDTEEINERGLRFWIDSMPYSKNKVKTIKELVPKKEQNTYLYPILKYHNNWKDWEHCLSSAFFEIETMIKKENLAISGYEAMSTKAKRKDIVNVKDMEETQPLYNSSGKHLKELLAYLKDNKIDNVAFIIPPRFYSKSMINERKILNTASKLIKQDGYKIYDLDQSLEAMQLDKNHDYYNAHANIYGQRKVTNYLIDTLKKDYSLEGKHNHKTKEKWDKEYETYGEVFNTIDRLIKAGDNKFTSYFKLRERGLIK